MRLSLRGLYILYYVSCYGILFCNLFQSRPLNFPFLGNFLGRSRDQNNSLQNFTQNPELSQQNEMHDKISHLVAIMRVLKQMVQRDFLVAAKR